MRVVRAVSYRLVTRRSCICRRLLPQHLVGQAAKECKGEQSCLGWKREKGTDNLRLGGSVVVLAVEDVHGRNQLAAENDGQVDDRPAAERTDERMVGEYLGDLGQRVGDEHLATSVD